MASDDEQPDIGDAPLPLGGLAWVLHFIPLIVFEASPCLSVLWFGFLVQIVFWMSRREWH